MPVRSIHLDFPFAGVHETPGDERQPPNTAVEALNVRPVDPQTRQDRGAQRAGSTRLTSAVLSGSNPVRAVAATNVVDNIGTTSRIDPAIIEDDFDRSGSGTSAGDLGDFDGDATDDWAVMIGTMGGESLSDAKWDAAYSSGKGAFVNTSDQVEDDQDASVTGMKVSACYFGPTNTSGVPTDNFAMEFQFHTHADLSNCKCVLGFFAFGDESTVSGGNYDNAVTIGFRVIGSSMEAHRYVNRSGSAGVPAWELQVFQNSYALTGNTTYTMECRVIGRRMQLFIEGTLWADIPDVTSSGGGTVPDVDAIQNSYGFFFYNVDSTGGGTNAKIAYIDNFKVYEALTTPPSRALPIVAVCNMDVLVGDESGTFTTGSGGDDAVNDADDICMFVGPGPTSASGDGVTYIYILDGQRELKVNPTTGVVSTWAHSNGSGGGGWPAGTHPRFGVRWQNAAFLFGNAQFPDNWYMSRSGDFDDFNYVSSTQPAIRAVAGDTSSVGLVGAEISCCAPSRADWILIASQRQLWAIIGHPNQGGFMDDVSDSIGIVGPYAWARDEAGSVYFVSFVGLHVSVTPRDQPIKLSERRLDRFFRSIDHSVFLTRCVWNADDDGLEIHFQRRSGTILATDPTAMFWHRPSNTFWPMQYPSAARPTCLASVRSETGRYVLMGCPDGHLRRQFAAAASDDGVAISSHLVYAPIVGADNGRTVLNALTPIITGSNSDLLEYQIRAADTAKEALTATARVSGQWVGGGMQRAMRRRVSGRAISVRLSNSDVDSHWSLERLVAEVELAQSSRRS